MLTEHLGLLRFVISLMDTVGPNSKEISLAQRPINDLLEQEYRERVAAKDIILNTYYYNKFSNAPVSESSLTERLNSILKDYTSGDKFSRNGELVGEVDKVSLEIEHLKNKLRSRSQKKMRRDRERKKSRERSITPSNNWKERGNRLKSHLNSQKTAGGGKGLGGLSLDYECFEDLI